MFAFQFGLFGHRPESPTDFWKARGPSAAKNCLSIASRDFPDSRRLIGSLPDEFSVVDAL